MSLILGGSMKVNLVAAISVFLFFGCSQNQQSQEAPAPVSAEIVPAKPIVDHYYAMRDGYEYGYEKAISLDDANAGQVASKLVMFKYAGNIDNKYQVFMKEGLINTVAECNNPCEFVKIMSFYNGVHTATERIRASEENLATTILMDAINGKLERYVGARKGKKVNVWFDEVDGMQAIPIQE